MAGGPKTWREALDWTKEAFAKGRYVLHPHAVDRMRTRRISILDIRAVIGNATKGTVYRDRAPLAGGTSWRIVGRDTDGEETTVGVEPYYDDGRLVLVVTVF